MPSRVVRRLIWSLGGLAGVALVALSFALSVQVAFHGRASADAPVAAQAPPGHPHRIPFELGAVEFYDGDEIAISEVWGSKPLFEVGGTYVVRGRYTLRSASTAKILFGLTVSKGSGAAPIPKGSEVAVPKGQGSFELSRPLAAEGTLHLTFYGSDGHPVGGVYFGSGQWLLKQKHWRYR